MRRKILNFIPLGLILLLSIGLVSAVVSDTVYYNWALEDDYTSDVNANTGTSTGVTFTTGKIAKGALFNAYTDIVSFPNKESVLDGVSMTYNLWIKIDSGESDATVILNKVSGDRVQHNIQYNGGTNVLSFGYSKPCTAGYSISESISKDKWHMLTFVINHSSNMIQSYLNGTYESQTGISDGTGGCGASTFEIGSTSQSPDSIMDEITQWNRVLSSTEISSLYNTGTGLTYPFSGISTYYGFNITAVNSTASINNFNATIKKGSINYNYTTTNGTIKTNSSTSLTSGYYNITIYSNGYSNWGLNNFYWLSTEKNNINSVLSTGGGSCSSSACTGDFYVSDTCTATIKNGDTYVVLI